MKIEDIIVKERIRRDLGDLSALKHSMNQYGLLYPLIINKKNQLIAGERRLTAAKELGWEEINTIVLDISPKDAFSIELNENTVRKNFNEIELTEGLKKHEELHSKNIFVLLKIFFKKILSFFKMKK